MSKLVSGVYAAVSTPRHADGRLDECSLRKSIEFLLERGIRGFALNGATGEYCLTTPGEIRRILAVARETMAEGAGFVCGIGSAGIRGCLDQGALAIEGGARAVLLPMPHFFPYEQDDLEVFCREVSERLPAPVLLYNLPQFTSGLQAATVETLIRECPNIAGIKDSSGSLEILRSLTRARVEACRIVGSDNVLVQALRERVCDAVISGVASVLPELMQFLFEQRGRPDADEFQQAVRALDEFIARISQVPVPWGLKWVAESRGIAAASFSQPVSARRLAQSRELQEWFRAWQSAVEVAV